MLKLDKETGRFYFHSADSHGNAPPLLRRHRFRWDTIKRLWYAPSLSAALGLREYADEETKSVIQNLFIRRSPWPHPLPIPPRGLKLLPHQEEAVRAALGQNRIYLRLDPGLGKTIVAATIARALAVQAMLSPNFKGVLPRVLYITPPFLFKNVLEEFDKWGAGDLIYLWPDSIITREEEQELIRKVANGFCSAVIVDEAHRFKSPDAHRTKALLGERQLGEHGYRRGLVDLFERQIFMSGTPMPNRPFELYPILSKAAPETIDFKTAFEYGLKYCDGFQDRNGWNFSGASNMKELAARVVMPQGVFMLRQKKALLNLPPKTERLFIISKGMSTRLAVEERELKGRYKSTDDLLKASIAQKAGKDKEKLSLATYRRMLGLEKVSAAVEYINYIVGELHQPLLVFAYHQETIKELARHLKHRKPFVITGATLARERHNQVKAFQAGQSNLMVANYQAAGVGFTMTRARRVLFVEYSWVPGENWQAGDRTHRIGQDQEVLIEYMVYKDSLDKRVMERVLEKTLAINHV